MNIFVTAFEWLFSPDQFTGGNSIPIRLVEHLFYTFVALIIAAVIAVPLGFFIGHTGKGRDIAVGISGAARALPSFGLILLFVAIFRAINPLNLNKPLAVFIALVLLGIPSILAGAYAGIEAVDRRTVDAARAVGMTEWQILWKVEVPLGLPLLIGGLRASSIQIVSTATLAAYIGLGGLGYYIFQGLPLRRYDEMLGGAILVALLALVIDGLLAFAQRAVTPSGVTAARPTKLRARST
jgi:osmoprotectant transport system permease protein